MADFLFIPGIFQTAWVWDEVVGRLEDALRRARPLLHEGYVPARWGVALLPGKDTPAPGRVRLGDWVSAVAETARRERLRRPVLVAHSTGAGVALSAVPALPEPPSRIVLVGGVVPDEGGSLMGALWWRARLTLALLGMASRRRGARLPRPLARRVLAPELEDPAFALIYGHTVPEPLSPLREPVRWREGVQGVPITYVMLEGDRFFPPHCQRRSLARLGEPEVLSLPAGHYAPLTHPDDLTRLLLGYGGLARQTLAA